MFNNLIKIIFDIICFFSSNILHIYYEGDIDWNFALEHRQGLISYFIW